MMLAFSVRRIVAANIALAPLSAVSLSACQGSSSSTTVLQCGAPAFDAQGPGYQTLAGGSVSAEGVSATFCNAGVELVDEGNTGAAPDSIFFTISSTTPFGLTDVRLPAGAVSQGLNVTLGLGKVGTGTYASTDSTSCGSIEFSYSIPSGSEVDCSAASAQMGCPAGCTQTFTCPEDAGVFQCCVPLGATYIYQASGAAICGGATGTQTALGSWSLNLTSVDRYSGDAGPEFEGVGLYAAHGTLSAKLQGTADTTETIDLTLSF